MNLEESFRKLRKRCGTGVSGMRNEYMRCLVGRFDDQHADRVMESYNEFATAAVNVELPLWFYSAWAIAGVSPLVKAKLTPEQEAAGRTPDVRPVAVGEADLRAISGHVTDGAVKSAAEILSPQQVAVGVDGGISLLIHGIKLTLELNREFVVVKLDLKNAYNSISRSVVLRRMQSHPELRQLVPFLHALGAAPTDLFVGMERATFGSSEGVQQGFPPSSLAFCIAIHPELITLDELLKLYGGCARATMDDVYAVGPAHAVFPALERFAATLKEMTDLEVQPTKYSCYSPEYDLTACPWRERVGAPVGVEEDEHGRAVYGIIVAGVPIGQPDYRRVVLAAKATSVVKYIEDTVAKLSCNAHALWAALYYCCQSRFDFWLRHETPHITRPYAEQIDAALKKAVESLGYDGMLDDEIVMARLRLPARRRGCGIRSRAWLAPIAFAACFIESAEGLIDRGGGALKGVFQHLEPMFGSDAFESNGDRFEHLIETRPGGEYYPSGSDLRDAWNELRARVPPGAQAKLLDAPAEQAGAGRGMLKLQKAITECIEEINFRALDDRIMQLPEGDERKVAWRSVDRLSSQWVASWPTHKHEYGHQRLEEVMTTYLGCESPIVRPYRGRTIPCGGNGGARVCDPHGSQLANAILPGGFTEPHDVIGWELFEITKEAGLPTELQPRHHFDSLIPVNILQDMTRNSGGIIADAAVTVALPPASHEPNQPRVAARPTRKLLFDIKTIYRGGCHYSGGPNNTMQSGAVMGRAKKVNRDYLRSARRLDRRHSAAGTTPIEDRLRSFTDVRGLVFGAYGEASRDVHLLLGVCATEIAKKCWREMGARTQDEARGFIIGQLRRRMGLITSEVMASHRLSRVPWIGVPRHVVVNRRTLAGPGGGARANRDGVVDAQDFFAHQQRRIAGGA